MKRRRFWSSSKVIGVVLGFVALMGLWGVRHAEQSRRAKSAWNLKQLGLAFWNYNDAYQVLPPGTIVDATGSPHLSWIASLIPYIDDNNIYNQIDLNLPWDHPRNQPVYRKVIPLFVITGVEEITDPRGYGLSHYAASSELFGENTSSTFTKLPLGTAHTVMAGEVAADFSPWGGPRNWRDPSAPLNAGSNSFGRSTGEGAHLLMADGSVRFVSNPPKQPAKPLD